MDTLSFGSILFYGLILSLTLSAMVLISLAVNPRMWIQDLPPVLREQLPPLDAAEKRQQRILVLIFMAAAIGIPLYAAWQLRTEEVSFLSAFLYVYLIYNVFNLFDLLILDGLLLTVIKPKFMFIPGTENMLHLYPSFGDHFRGFLKGLVISVVFCLPIALVAVL